MNDNQQNKNLCPICGSSNTVSAAYCGCCGWEFKVFPSTISQSYQNQENKRCEQAKGYVNALHQKEHIIVEEKEQAEQKLKEAEIKLMHAEGVIRTNKDEYNRALDLDKSKSKSLEQQLREAKLKLSDANMQLEAQRKETDQLKEQLSVAKDKLQTASTPLKGIVSIKNRNTDNLCYLPVYNGFNTYGTAPDNGNHHEIKMRIRGINILPKHFSVELQKDRLCLRDLSNGNITFSDNSRISPEGVFADARILFLINSTLEIHVSQI